MFSYWLLELQRNAWFLYRQAIVQQKYCNFAVEIGVQIFNHVLFHNTTINHWHLITRYLITQDLKHPDFNTSNSLSLISQTCHPRNSMRFLL